MKEINNKLYNELNNELFDAIDQEFITQLITRIGRKSTSLIYYLDKNLKYPHFTEFNRIKDTLTRKIYETK